MTEQIDGKPKEPLLGRHWYLKVIPVVAIVGVWWAPTIFQNFLPAKTTTCSELVPQVISIAKENTSIFNVKILDVVEVKNISSQEDKIECTGLAILNNTEKQQIDFSTYQEYGKWWVEFHPHDS